MTGIAANTGMLCWLSESNGLKYFLHSCPFALLFAPATAQVMEAHAWWEKGQLGIRYPAGIPITLSRAIMDYEHGRIKGDNDRYERERRQRQAGHG